MFQLLLHICELFSSSCRNLKCTYVPSFLNTEYSITSFEWTTLINHKNRKVKKDWQQVLCHLKLKSVVIKPNPTIYLFFAYTRFYCADTAKHVPAGWRPLTCGLAPVWLHCTATSWASLLYRPMSGRWWAAEVRGWCVCGRPGWEPSCGRCTTGGLNSQQRSWTYTWASNLCAFSWLLKHRSLSTALPLANPPKFGGTLRCSVRAYWFLWFWCNIYGFGW